MSFETKTSWLDVSSKLRLSRGAEEKLATFNKLVDVKTLTTNWSELFKLYKEFTNTTQQREFFKQILKNMADKNLEVKNSTRLEMYNHLKTGYSDRDYQS